jgi:hypothetical protein
VKAGDRVIVIAETDEYTGLSGELVEVNEKGDLVVDVEIPKKYRAVFKPHELAVVKRRER